VKGTQRRLCGLGDTAIRQPQKEKNDARACASNRIERDEGTACQSHVLYVLSCAGALPSLRSSHQGTHPAPQASCGKKSTESCARETWDEPLDGRHVSATRSGYRRKGMLSYLDPSHDSFFNFLPCYVLRMLCSKN
jgi:hypothetical protein